MTPEVPGFEIERLLGEGARCRVYLARESTGLRRPVALKVFAGAAERSAWDDEVALMSAIEELRRREREPAIVQSLGSGSEGDLAWIAFEWLEAGTLADTVAREGALDAARAVDLVRQAARALRLLHAEGLFHRDVKPSNLLLGADGRVRVADFGLSRPLDGLRSAAGTPAFAAPEVVAGRPFDGRRTDVYSLGATLAYLLTGRTMPPGRPDVFALERAGVPRPLQELIVASTAADPADRTSDVEAFLAALPPSPDGPPSDPAPLAPAPAAAADPEERRAAAQELIEKCGYAAAALTLLPIPVSELVAVVPIHVGLVVGLGQVHGVPVAREDATRMLGRIAAAAGLSLLGSRVATTAAKLLLPGLGGALGAPFMFASTLAIGRVADAQLERLAAEGDGLSDEQIGRIYRENLRDARRRFDPARARSQEARTLAEEAQDGPGTQDVADAVAAAAEPADPSGAAGAGDDDVETVLERLADLHARGAIDAEEYRSLKRQALRRL